MLVYLFITKGDGGTMIRLSAALLLVGIGLSPARAASGCEVPFTKMIPDVTVTGQIYAVSGKSCGIGVAESVGGAQSHQITRRPSNGKVEIRGFAIYYTSRPGFVGNDSFSYVRHSLDSRTNRPITLPVNIDVTVAAR